MFLPFDLSVDIFLGWRLSFLRDFALKMLVKSNLSLEREWWHRMSTRSPVFPFSCSVSGSNYLENKRRHDARPSSWREKNIWFDLRYCIVVFKIGNTRTFFKKRVSLYCCIFFLGNVHLYTFHLYWFCVAMHYYTCFFPNDTFLIPLKWKMDGKFRIGNCPRFIQPLMIYSILWNIKGSWV